MDFQLIGIGDQGPNQQFIKHTEVRTEDHATMDTTEQLHPVINSTVLETETQSTFALDRFLRDSGPWCVFDVPSYQPSSRGQS